LAIFEYIDILNLYKEKTRLLILKQKQNYLNKIFSEDKPSTHNILKTVDSLLGYNHSLEVRAKIKKHYLIL
jgi:hypothetical protein